MAAKIRFWGNEGYIVPRNNSETNIDKSFTIKVNNGIATSIEIVLFDHYYQIATFISDISGSFDLTANNFGSSSTNTNTLL